MFTFDYCHKIIQHTIQRANEGKEPYNLYEPIRYILSNGGKRIRPVLLLMSCNLFNESVDKAISPALAIEIFHNFTLMHDDIMDHSEMRRNKATVHKKWDVNTAILSGDTMCILAYHYLMQVPDQYLRHVLQTFNSIGQEICQGQQLDLDFATRTHVGESDYITMIEKKTASLIGGSINIGAIVGNASAEDARNLYEFGRNIGIAFQLQDDLLDVYGNAEQFGKQIGSDIVENKKTYLLIKAYELASPEQRDVLDNLFQQKSISPDNKVQEVTKIYDVLNIKGVTDSAISHYFNKAKSLLEKVSVEHHRKSEIEQLVEQLINRGT